MKIRHIATTFALFRHPTPWPKALEASSLSSWTQIQMVQIELNGLAAA